MTDDRGYLHTVETWHSAALEHIHQLSNAFVQFRRALRDLLGKHGVPSNPGWSELDIIDGFKTLLDQRPRADERILDALYWYYLTFAPSDHVSHSPNETDCRHCDTRKLLVEAGRIP